ncbi:MAG: Fic family protein, partial [Gemmatimonadota bacterium]|nr:Fic family protein [Gemmatimonadota bacterium]
MYLWERPGWPALSWDEKALSTLLASVSRRQGLVLGRMEALGFHLRDEAHLRTLTEDVVKSSEIEGEDLDRDQVRSSIARRLGLDAGGLVPADREVEGVVEMMLDATGKYEESLTEERLFAWHTSLFPTGRSGMRKIIVGKWRDDRTGPMQVVSGPAGGERVHYEAPPAERLPEEMARFLSWFEDPGDIDPLLTAGLAHLLFVTIHPFDDGNGRIARAIADMVLSRSESSRRRFYSMSAQIRRERNDYYAILESTQKGGVDVTQWQTWFLSCLLRAIEGAHGILGFVLRKARFWERFATEPLNERQIAILNRLLDG